MTTEEWRERSSELMSLLSSSEDAAASVRDSILMLGSAGGLVFRGAAMTSTANERDLGCGNNNIRRRPFISLQEELAMEDYCFDDLMLPEKKRRLTPEQVHLLEKSFEEENKLEPEKKSELSKKLGLQPRQVAVWYQNRRARWKTKQLERDFGRLKTLYDSLVADRDSLLADNQRLRSEVLSLTEQLQAKSSSSSQDLSLKQDWPHPLMEEVPESSKVLPSSTTSSSPEIKSDDGLISTVDDTHPLGGGCQGNVGEGLCFQEQLDGGSFNGQCSYVIPSEEEDISDDGGGGCFHAILPADDALILDHHFLYRDDDEELKFLPEEDGGGGFVMGWSVWS